MKGKHCFGKGNVDIIEKSNDSSNIPLGHWPVIFVYLTSAEQILLSCLPAASWITRRIRQFFCMRIKGYQHFGTCIWIVFQPPI